MAASETPARAIRLGMVGGGEGAFIGAVHRMAARLDAGFDLVAGARMAGGQQSLSRILFAACTVANLPVQRVVAPTIAFIGVVVACLVLINPSTCPSPGDRNRPARSIHA